MKTTVTGFALVSLMLSILPCLTAQAQDGQYFLQSIEALKPLYHKNTDGRTVQSANERELQLQAAAKTINAHREEVARLRAKGKSEAEIHASLTAIASPAATGSIEGILYQSDGVTPVSSYASAGAYNEFGMYAGYGYALGSNGVYKIQNLPTGNYYVQLDWSGSGQYIPVYYNDVEDWRHENR